MRLVHAYKNYCANFGFSIDPLQIAAAQKLDAFAEDLVKRNRITKLTTWERDKLDDVLP